MSQKFHHISQLLPRTFYWFSATLRSESIEVWQYIKQELSWGLYDNLDKIERKKFAVFLKNFQVRNNRIYLGWDFI